MHSAHMWELFKSLMHMSCLWNLQRVSQVSVALSGEVRNAASAAFSSRSIEGESALSHNGKEHVLH